MALPAGLLAGCSAWQPSQSPGLEKDPKPSPCPQVLIQVFRGGPGYSRSGQAKDLLRNLPLALQAARVTERSGRLCRGQPRPGLLEPRRPREGPGWNPPVHQSLQVPTGHSRTCARGTVSSSLLFPQDWGVALM